MKETKEDSKKKGWIHKKKLFSIFIVSVLLLSSSVLAFFLFSFDNSVTYEVVGSKKDLVIVLDLSNQVLNVSENLVNEQNFKLVNQNGAAEMTYTLNTNVTNLDPLNCDATGDISFELTNSTGGVINEPSNFTMVPGINNFNFTATAVNNRVCPQNIIATLDFSEL